MHLSYSGMNKQKNQGKKDIAGRLILLDYKNVIGFFLMSKGKVLFKCLKYKSLWFLNLKIGFKDM
jgi:hypothetical protein